MEIIGDVCDEEDDDVGVSGHERGLIALFQVLVDSLDEWLDLRPRGRRFGARRFLDLADLLCLLPFCVRQGRSESYISMRIVRRLM